MNTDTPPCPLTDCQFNNPNFTGHCSAEVADEPLYPDCKKRIQAMTPPQPAHGEPWRKWSFAGLEDVVDESGYIVIHDAHYITPTLRDRLISCVNILAPHPDLSAVEVHSKETMDEVRGVLKLFEQISSIQKPALLGGWNWPQLNKQAESALAKLNPPQG